MLKITHNEILNNSWIDKVKTFWKSGNLDSITVDRFLKITDKFLIKGVISSIKRTGVYEKGQRAIITVVPEAIDMAVVASVYLNSIGIEPRIILMPDEDIHICSSLMEILDTEEKLKKLASATFKSISWVTKDNKKGNWISISRMPYFLSKVKKENYDLLRFKQVFSYSVNFLFAELNKRTLISRNMFTYPSLNDAEKLGISFDKWKNIFFKALNVSSSDIIKEIKSLPFYKYLLESSLNGKNVRIIDKEGTDLVLNLKKRPILAETGKAGDVSLDNTGPYYVWVTNHYSGECCAAPVENSANGVIYGKGPIDSIYGCIEDYSVAFEKGRVVEKTNFTDRTGQNKKAFTKAKKGNTALKKLTGLMNVGKVEKDEAESMKKRGLIAELGIGPVNPVLKKETSNFKTFSGNILLDEKLMLHIGIGANDFLGGNNSSTCKGVSIRHNDFILTNKFDIISE